MVRGADISLGTLEVLAKADAFQSFGLSARDAFWYIKKMRKEQFHRLPLFAAAKVPLDRLSGEQEVYEMPQASASEKLVMDYGITGLSLRGHPVSFLAPYFEKDNWQGCASAAKAQHGKRLRLIGLVTMRQRPGTAKGTMFVTMEEAEFSLNVIIWPHLTQTYRKALLGARLLGIVGRIQKEGQILHFIAETLHACDHYLDHLRTKNGVSFTARKARHFR